MKEYDLVVIGSGAGLVVVENALAHGYSVALVDRGPLGGTCLNLGCIPSKMLIFPADLVAEIRDSARLGIEAVITKVHFKGIMDRMRKAVQAGERHIRSGIRNSSGELDYYEGEGRFVKDYTLEIKGEEIRGRRIVIATGARPEIPNIPGLTGTPYLTNESVLGLSVRPESIIIIGGGYVAAEYAHFFASMGSLVTVIQRNPRLLPEEEPEISILLKREYARRMQVHTSMEAAEVRSSSRGVSVVARTDKGGQSEFTAERIMVAAGRRSNADLLAVEKSGIETDGRDYIKVNSYFETSKKGIWSFGDAIGKRMFRHVANREALVVWRNVAHNAKMTVDYLSAPHAVFSYPEVASVGLTEAEAKKVHGARNILVGRAKYSDVARGEAMREELGFAKAIVKKSDGKILGFHIIGPSASILIQEVVNVMANGGNVESIAKAMHIHPALTELVVATLARSDEIEGE